MTYGNICGMISWLLAAFERLRTDNISYAVANEEDRPRELLLGISCTWCQSSLYRDLLTIM